MISIVRPMRLLRALLPVAACLALLASCEMMSAGGMDEEEEGVRGYDITLVFDEIRIVGDCDQATILEPENGGPGEFAYEISVFVSEGPQPITRLELGNWAESDETVELRNFRQETFRFVNDPDDLFVRSDGESIDLQPAGFVGFWLVQRFRYHVHFSAAEYDIILSTSDGLVWIEDTEMPIGPATQTNRSGPRVTSSTHTLSVGDSNNCRVELSFTAEEVLRVRTDTNGATVIP